jgi:hypothetical protein
LCWRNAKPSASIKVLARNRWHTQFGELEGSLIKGFFAKMCAGLMEITKGWCCTPKSATVSLRARVGKL